jgi:hypothetical protein
VLLLALTYEPTALAGSPRIEFEKTVWDFGKTSQVQIVTGSFVFRNTGDAVLKLEEPTTTCGCIVPTLSAQSLEPGQKGEVSFTLSMPSVRKMLEQHVTVPSNDPENPKVTLTAKVLYVPLFEIEPILLQLEAKPGQTTNLAVLVRRTDGRALNLTRIEPTKPWIKATAQKGRESNATEARILIEASLEGSPRYFTEWVRFFVDNSDQPATSAVLMGRVLGDLTVSPETLLWNLTDSTPIAAAERKARMTRRLVITSSAPGQALELRKVTSTLKEVQVELVPREAGKTYELVAQLTSPPNTTVRGTVSFETNLPSQPTIEVPVTIIVAAK